MPRGTSAAAGLTVRAVTGTPPGSRDVLIRKPVKVAPGQLGHTAAMHFAAATETLPAGAVAYHVLSMARLLVVAGPPLLQRRGLHDVAAGMVESLRSSRWHHDPTTSRRPRPKDTAGPRRTQSKE